MTPAMPQSSRLSASARSSRSLMFVLGGIALMTLSAKVQIPFWPVPMTLHTMAVMGFAVLFGPRIAVAVFMGYLAAGAVGLPVFSGTPERGIGLGYMLGPTGGYLLGYLIASALTGWMATGRGMLMQTCAMLAGLAVVYAAGAIWLSAFVPVQQVFAVGVLPFLLGDLVKIAVVALGAQAIVRLRGQS